MKKEALAPLLTFIAMMLLVVSRLISNEGELDLLGYLAITVAIGAAVILKRVFRKSE